MATWSESMSAVRSVPILPPLSVTPSRFGMYYVEKSLAYWCAIQPLEFAPFCLWCRIGPIGKEGPWCPSVYACSKYLKH